MRVGGYPALLFSLHRIHKNKQNRPDSAIIKKIPVLITKFFVWRCEAGLKKLLDFVMEFFVCRWQAG
jgi:hypothetical protein